MQNNSSLEGCLNGPEYGYLNLLAQEQEISYDYEIVLSSESEEEEKEIISSLIELVEDEVTNYITTELLCGSSSSKIGSWDNIKNETITTNGVYNVNSLPTDEINTNFETCATLEQQSNPNCYPISGHVSVTCDDACNMIVLQTVRDAMSNLPFDSLSDNSISQVIFLGERMPPKKSTLDTIAFRLSSQLELLKNNTQITALGGSLITLLLGSFILLIYRIRKKRSNMRLYEFEEDEDVKYYPTHTSSPTTTSDEKFVENDVEEQVFTRKGYKTCAIPKKQRPERFIYDEPVITKDDENSVQSSSCQTSIDSQQLFEQGDSQHDELPSSFPHISEQENVHSFQDEPVKDQGISNVSARISMQCSDDDEEFELTLT